MDSELGVLVEDEEGVAITMNGEPFVAGRVPHQLRLRLWQEHLGIPEEKIDGILDPVSEEVFHGIILKTAQTNTEIYERVFPGIPNNRHSTMTSFVASGGLKVPVEAVTDGSELHDVQGHFTLHPIGFLQDEEMATLRSKIMGDVWWQ
jgi:phospholipase D1/2